MNKRVFDLLHCQAFQPIRSSFSMQFHKIRKTYMSPFVSISLDRFNQQVLACQDEAFTLAFSILGEESAACEVVLKAIQQVYSDCGKEDIAIAVNILQCMILLCRKVKPSKKYNPEEWIPGWNQLEHNEQEALLLVDVLQKSYQEAAVILNNSVSGVARVVAHGRYKLIRNSDSVPE